MRSLVVVLALAPTITSFAGCSSTPSSSGAGAAGNGADASNGAEAGNLPDAIAAGDAANEIGAAGSGGSDTAGTGGAGAGVARLVPWQVESDGTDPLVMGIYDSQEKVHCRFLPDETGQLRCLPWALASFAETTSFSDAACTKRIYLNTTAVGPTWAGHPTALPLPRTACAQRRYTVATLKVLPSSSPHFGGTPCAELQPPPEPGPGNLEMTVVDAQTTDRYEKGTEVAGPLIGGRMRVKLVEAPGGARFVDSFLEEHWSAPCHLVASGNDVTCEASAAHERVGFEGTQCTGHPVWRSHACDAPVFLFAFPAAFALGPPWTGPVSISGHGCEQLAATSTSDGPDIFFEAGAPLGDAVMAAEAWRPAGTGRVRLRGLADGGGNVVTFPTSLLWSEGDSAVLTGAHARYFDTVANTNCNPIRTPDGTLRCVPTSVAPLQGTVGFADDKCTDPVFNCPNYAASCPGIFAMAAGRDANGEMHGEALNASRAVTRYFTSDGGTCSPSPFTTPGVFALGAAAPWTQFPAFTERNGRAPDGP